MHHECCNLLQRLIQTTGAPDNPVVGGPFFFTTMKNFPIPKGFQIPDGVEPGQTFETVATVALGDDGMLTVTAFDGAELEDMDKPDEETPSPDAEDQTNPDFVKAVMAEMG